MTLSDLTEILNSIELTPDAISTTRELILRFAMMGRISKPHVGDIPVSGLLSTIEDEKAQRGITKSKRHSKTKSEITSEEKACSIPDHWIWIRLGEIAQHNAGKTLDKGRNSGELRNYITTSNLYWGYFQIDQVKQMLIRDNELERCRATKGDLLICEGGEAGRAAVWPFDYDIAFQNHIHRARFYGGIDPHYVQLVFEKLNLVGDINRFRKGVGISNMSGKSLASIPIPLPPVAEQIRIVAKVDELMALCDQLEAQQQERDKQHAALARASLARFANDPTPDNLQFLFHRSYDIDPEDLRKTVLNLAIQGRLVSQDSRDEPAVDLYSHINRVKESLIKQSRIKKTKVEANPKEDDAGPLPSGWFWTRLGNCFDVRDGTHDTPKYVNKGYPLITSKNIYSGYLDFDNVRFISETDHRQISERSRVDRGDVLFAMIGSIGNPAIVDTDRKFSIKNVALFKYCDDVSFEPRFLHLYLSHVADEMKEKAMGGVQSFVSLGFLRNYVFPLPPLAEQKRIVAKVDELMALVDELETQLASSREVARNLLEALVAELTAA